MPRGIGLVLLDYDQAATTLRCLRSVAAGTRRPDEIVLVENGGPPVDLASDEVLADLVVHVLRPERNIGAASARNLGFNYLVRNSDVERYVLLDNDTTVPGGFFELVDASSFEPLEIAAPLISRWTRARSSMRAGDFDRYRYPSVIPEWPGGSTAPAGGGLGTDRRTGLRSRYLAPRRAGSMTGTDSVGRTSSGATGRCEWELWYAVEPQLRVIHEAHQSSGGAFSPERLRQWSRNGTVFIFETAGWRSRLNWFSMEFRLIWGELRAGWSRLRWGVCGGSDGAYGRLAAEARPRCTLIVRLGVPAC